MNQCYLCLIPIREGSLLCANCATISSDKEAEMKRLIAKTYRARYGMLEGEKA